MKNILLKMNILVFTLLSVNMSFADDMKIKPKGGFDFQAAYFKSNAPSKYQYITQNKKHMGFNTSVYLGLEVSNELDNGFKYGAKIAISPTTNSSRKIQSGIFTESDFGRLELGSEKNANSKMKITPFSIASGSGGLWDVWVKGDPLGEIQYVMNYGSFLDNKMRNAGKTEFSRKVTYYTPEIKGLQIGISYIPDSTNVGYAGFKEDFDKSPIRHTSVQSKHYYYSVKDGFAGGITYKNEFDKGTYLKLSAVGELGRVKVLPKSADTPLLKGTNIKSYTLGGEFTLNEYSLAACYGNYLRSLTYKDETNKDTDMYGIGGRYKLNKFSTSLTYFTSNHKRNKMEAATVAFDYKIAPGIMPYAEVTLFKAKGRYINQPADKLKTKHEGSLLLLGTKVEF